MQFCDKRMILLTHNLSFKTQSLTTDEKVATLCGRNHTQIFVRQGIQILANRQSQCEKTTVRHSFSPFEWNVRKIPWNALYSLLYYILLNMFQTLIRPSSGASEYLLCCVGWLEACWCYVAGLSVGDVVSECRLNHWFSLQVQPTLGYHITNRQSRYITPARPKSAYTTQHVVASSWRWTY